MSNRFQNGRSRFQNRPLRVKTGQYQKLELGKEILADQEGAEQDREDRSGGRGSGSVRNDEAANRGGLCWEPFTQLGY
jgi:hypothetical protein